MSSPRNANDGVVPMDEGEDDPAGSVAQRPVKASVEQQWCRYCGATPVPPPPPPAAAPPCWRWRPGPPTWDKEAKLCNTCYSREKAGRIALPAGTPAAPIDATQNTAYRFYGYHKRKNERKAGGAGAAVETHAYDANKLADDARVLARLRDLCFHFGQDPAQHVSRELIERDLLQQPSAACETAQTSLRGMFDGFRARDTAAWETLRLEIEKRDKAAVRRHAAAKQLHGSLSNTKERE